MPGKLQIRTKEKEFKIKITGVGDALIATGSKDMLGGLRQLLAQFAPEKSSQT